LHMAQLMPLSLTVSCFSNSLPAAVVLSLSVPVCKRNLTSSQVDKQLAFYPRNSLLARYTTSCGPVSVSPSVTSRCSVETAE